MMMMALKPWLQVIFLMVNLLNLFQTLPFHIAHSLYLNDGISANQLFTTFGKDGLMNTSPLLDEVTMAISFVN